MYLYDSMDTQSKISSKVTQVGSIEALREQCADGYSFGIDASSGSLEVIMVASGIASTDNYRAAYALSLLSLENNYTTEIIGQNDKEMKKRREITCEFLFFELTAVGFLGVASMLFKEKQMGVIRVHGILPVNKSAFILSKLCLLLLAICIRIDAGQILLLLLIIILSAFIAVLTGLFIGYFANGLMELLNGQVRNIGMNLIVLVVHCIVWLLLIFIVEKRKHIKKI